MMKNVRACPKCQGRGGNCKTCGGTGKIVQRVDEGGKTRQTKQLNEA